MNTVLPSDSWELHWAMSARDVPQGRLLAGFLVDLVVDTSRMREVNSVCFPRDLAAHALGVEPVRLMAALRSLAKARLLTWQVEGAPDAPNIVVTLLPSAPAGFLVERRAVQRHEIESPGVS
ncbi:hypothetical protein ACIRP3_18815 [Streptomyces sp. NPDC101209]|uniref:hypothetical protein n=1 Tax=Streptomyces sp. NPDC101209 TaxID=3366129 RepID=UPI003822C155